MHNSSYQHMQVLYNRYLMEHPPKTVLDIGSYDVNGTYKPIFENGFTQYAGLDLIAGPNVDIVNKSSISLHLPSNSFDLVISGQAFEHAEYFWMTWLEMVRITKTNGLIFLIAPSRGPEHRHPQDCWRFYPDGFRTLAKFGRCDLLEINTDWIPDPDPGSSAWGDTVGVFKKSKRGVKEKIIFTLFRFSYLIFERVML